MINKSNVANHDLSRVSESLLLPLYIRAQESQRPDAILKDKRAFELVQKLKLDASQFSHAEVGEEVQVSVLLRCRQFDRITSDYLTRHPDAVIVHLACGLDTRFERLDNGRVEWYDLDLAEVIDLRRELIGDEAERYHLLACSALGPAWMDVVKVHYSRPFLFLAEGLFMFFEEAQVMQLVLAMKDHFPSSELVFDAFSPFYVWGNNRRVARTKIGAATHWALKNGKALENWAEGIRLMDEWYPFLCPEPRLAHIRWVRFIPLLSKTTGIFHYRLGLK
jgi:O-methyltransferase involved in polyketide biosynthesis